MKLNSDQQELIRDMTKSHGWFIFKNFIIDKIETCRNQLERGEFTTLAEVTKLQGTISALRSLLAQVERWTEEK